MAKFKSPAEFINTNVDLLSQRQSSMYSVFLESKPTPTTYYHVNKIRSRTDKGLKMPERLNGVLSPIRYNKLINFPLFKPIAKELLDMHAHDVTKSSHIYENVLEIISFLL